MAKTSEKYELMYIINPNFSEEETAAVVEKFKALIAENAEVTGVNEWGKRRLAYPINDKMEGYYVLVTFKAEGEFPAELERIYGITEGIMRAMVIKLDEKAIAEFKQQFMRD